MDIAKQQFSLPFCKVTLFFLPVGHTHEDIDAQHAKISVSLRKNNCLSYKNLITTILDCHKGMHKVIDIGYEKLVCDYRAFFSSFKLKPITEISKKFAFCFEKGGNGGIFLRYIGYNSQSSL